MSSTTLPVILAADEGRTAAPLNIVGETTLAKISPEDSEGRYAVFHLEAPPMSGPPLHVHSREDEFFYVLDGELVFEVDGVSHGNAWRVNNQDAYILTKDPNFNPAQYGLNATQMKVIR